jgi:ankyrin repeat protein
MKITAEGELTLLMLAVERGHLDVCKYLLDNGADPNFPAVLNGESILYKAIRRDDVEIISLLLRQYKIAFGVTVQSLPPPGLAAANCCNRSLYLFTVAQPHSFEKMASLVPELRQNQIRLAHMLLPEDKTSWYISQSFIDTLSKASDNMLRLLIHLDWPDESSEIGSWCTLLHVACRRGDIRLARRLISLHSGPDRDDHTGRTPLALAADIGYIDLVSALLESGRVKLTRLSTPEKPVLANRAKYNNRITERLFEADPSLKTLSDTDGRTLLHHALYAENDELIRYLIIHTHVDMNTLLQSHPSYERVSRRIDPASITSLRMALELGSEAVDWHLSPEVANEFKWNAESFELISEALLASDMVDLSSLECGEELQYLALAAKLGSERLTWSLIKKGLLSCWKGLYCDQQNVAELMLVLKEDIQLLMASATNKNLLGDTLNKLVGNIVELNAGNSKGEIPHQVAYIHGNLDIYSLLKRGLLNNTFGKAGGGLIS